jgi:hypothetical protein
MNETEKSHELLQINDEMKGYFLSIAKWAKFLSIMGFIGVGFMLLLAFVELVMRSSLGLMSIPRVGTGFIAVFLIIGALLYFLPAFFLYVSSTKITNGIKTNNDELLTSGLEFLKMQYKFKGIALIVLLSFYLITMSFTIIFAALR